MILSSVFFHLGGLLALLSLLMAVPGFVGLGAGEGGGYLAGAAASAFCGVGLMLAAGAGSKGARFREAILLFVIAWPVLGAFAAIPFVIAGAPFSAAYFDAVSALTTTGAWVSREAAYGAPADLLWRALLLWFGGLMSLTAAAAVFARSGFVGEGMPRLPIALADEESVLRSVRRVGMFFAPIYGALTLVCFAALVLGGADGFDALCLALSTMATGGLAPPGAEGAFTNPFLQIVLIVFMAVAASNFILISRTIVSRRSLLRKPDLETVLFYLAIFGVAMVLWLASDDPNALLQSLFLSASLLSTTGIGLAETNAPVVVCLIAAIIGGAAVSTAGGFKIIRWLSAFRGASEELWKLNHPRGVAGGDGQGLFQTGVWIYFITFTLALTATLFGLAMGGVSFDVAIAMAIAALSNTGPLVELAGASDYSELSPFLRLLLCIVMIFGRLEAAAALALLNLAFWRS